MSDEKKLNEMNEENGSENKEATIEVNTENSVADNLKPVGQEPDDPNMTINVKNEGIEEMLKVYAADKTVENLNKLVSLVHISRVLVPANLNEQQQPIPIFIKNNSEEMYLPIYTSKEQIPSEPKSPVIINMPYLTVNEMALKEELNVTGVVINPFTDNLIFKAQLIQKIAEVEKSRKENPKPKTQTVKLSPQQYAIFERQQYERIFLPTKLFDDGQNFMDELTSRKEEFLDVLFEESYQQKRMYPYLEEDFSVMPMSISEELTLVRVDMPTRDMAPGCSLRVYLSWDNSNDTGRYFLIEKGNGSELLLGEMDSEHKHITHGAAPAEGAELQRVLDLIKGEITS